MVKDYFQVFKDAPRHIHGQIQRKIFGRKHKGLGFVCVMDEEFVGKTFCAAADEDYVGNKDCAILIQNFLGMYLVLILARKKGFLGGHS